MNHAIRFPLRALALCAAAALAPLSGPVLASHIGEDLTTDQQSVAANDQLVAGLAQLESAPPAARDARLRQLVQLAEQRKVRLLRLLERNPRLATMRLLPSGLRERLPAQAQVHVESDLHATGAVFAAVGDDFARGLSKQRFYLQPDGGGTRLELHLADAVGAERALLALAGRRAAIDGTALDGHLIVKDKRNAQLTAAGGTGTTTAVVPSTAAVVQGDQKTLVVLAHFSDKALTCTAADVSGRVFGATGATVNNNYLESSRNVVSFSGQVVGPFPIAYTSTGSCDYNGWGTALEAALKAAGIDSTQYARVNYVTPPNSTCGWSGLAYMPGRKSWVQSCASTGVYSHELGHNLSFHHAGTPTAEYGDSSDPMGGARVVRANGANQAMAGWLPPGAMQDVTTPGTFSLSALELGSATSAQVLRLPKPDTNETYYVSLRQATALDATLSSTFVNALSIHRSTGTLPARTILEKTLPVGGSFTDTVNGVTITHQALAGSIATVGISFAGGTCARSAPGVALTPATLSAGAGTVLSYTVAVTNTNSAACGTGTFNITQALPGGLSGSLAASSLAIVAGASASTTLQVTSSTTATNGTYTFDVSAADAASPAPSVAHGAYIVYSDNTPPAVALTSPGNGATLSGRSATLKASASDASGIASVEFYAGSTLLARDTSAPYSANWNLRKAAKGPYTLRVRATDKAGNVAEQTISVTVQ